MADPSWVPSAAASCEPLALRERLRTKRQSNHVHGRQARHKIPNIWADGKLQPYQSEIRRPVGHGHYHTADPLVGQHGCLA